MSNGRVKNQVNMVHLSALISAFVLLSCSFVTFSRNTSIQMKKSDLFWKDLAISMCEMARMSGYVLRLFLET